jgi:hypothetical protein
MKRRWDIALDRSAAYRVAATPGAYAGLHWIWWLNPCSSVETYVTNRYRLCKTSIAKHRHTPVITNMENKPRKLFLSIYLASHHF